MADIASLNTVYNHYMTAYSPSGTNSKYDTHKKSELRGVVNSIVKLNKDAPVFLIDNSKETKDFAISLKENARSLKNTISSLSEDSDNEMLSKKTVSSSNEDLVSASYIGTKGENPPAGIELTIEQLAGGQINKGNSLPPDQMGLPPDTYSFDIRSRDIDYEFQFNINEGDTNKSIEEKLARLITRSNIGIHAETSTDQNGNISLLLNSDDTGVKGDSGLQFIVSDDKTSKQRGAVTYFGIDNVEKAPTDAIFTINGKESSSPSNNVRIDKVYEINLKGTTSEGETVSVGVKTDVESLTDNINNLVMGYNSFLQNASKFLESQPQSKALVKEMAGLSAGFNNELEAMGVNFDANGLISLDKNLIQQTAMEDDSLTRFDNVRKFANNILDKANSISLDPLQYTNKKIVAYKNPNANNFASPYITSNYSGMMFSSYC
ncbi:MAG: flagellar filament capping protein FliD [Lachnospiraceae bacterium]|nr:flagellar filament capping protein FliD [Lachnospiraceae bacterium]